jgi:hypothetical protein
MSAKNPEVINSNLGGFCTQPPVYGSPNAGDNLRDGFDIINAGAKINHTGTQ